jgi:outer membrane lipoprotein-sorting protein
MIRIMTLAGAAAAMAMVTLPGTAGAQTAPLLPPALIPNAGPAPAGRAPATQAPVRRAAPSAEKPVAEKPAAQVPAAAARSGVPLPLPRPTSLDTKTAAADGTSGEPLTLAAKTAAAPVDPQVLLGRINAALNSVSVMSGDFVQTNASGRRSTGRLYVQKPGKLRFEYDAPSPLEIVADGRSVVIRDRKLNTQDMYSISQTPLKFLLREQIDLARDTSVLDVRNEGDRAMVTLEDKSTFGGTSRITLAFDSRSLALRQWTVRDPQGYETVVTLSNLDVAQRPDPALFTINYQRMQDSKR